MIPAGATRWAWLVGSVLAVALTGCSDTVEGIAEGTVERALEDELGDSVDVEIGADGYTVDTEDGTTTVGDGEVPPDFPSDFPLVDGEVTFAQSLDTGDATTWTVLVTAAGDPAAITEQVLGQLESGGYAVDQAGELSSEEDSGGSLLAEKDDVSALVVVAQEGGDVAVTYSVTRDPSAG